MRRRTTARAVGVLFLIATAAGVLSVVFLGQPDTEISRESVMQGARTTTMGALMVLIMAAAIAMIPPLIFPVLKERSEPLALGYAVSRTVEVVLLLPGAVGPLMVVAVSRDALPPGSPNADARLQTAYSLTQTYADWGHPVSSIFFCLSVLLLNWVLYRSSIVPRLISAWALIAVAPYLADGLLVMFGVLSLSAPLHTILIVPLAVNEMVLALWLLIRGFNRATPLAEASTAGRAEIR
ncbi:DUF4386 domain-containing protein [Nonomuraea turcica]|uniref:DUF4386 domain-containing protein n=1 Tax=Nonomuraea sp. G32 TaxID=3067274 RepID=UPI00273CA750|nr:DUF4386 domain-containing protein [Nonomuraea sp. G32]MDP4506121.1 DUF4386 domain-containing protein [Nonomuraea sp. G32]